MRSKTKITIRDIAKNAGVSRGLVSLFMRDKTYKNGGTVGLSEQTENLIIKAARELNYQPENLDMRLRLYPSSGGLGILIGRNSATGFAPFYSEIMIGAVGAMSQTEMNVNLSLFDQEYDYLANPEGLPYCITDNHTSKFMVMGGSNYSLLLALKQANRKVCCMLRECNVEGVVSIVPDYEAAAYDAVKYLMAMGHKHIGFAAEHYFHKLSYSHNKIIRGLTRALKEAGIKFTEAMVVYNREENGDLPSTIWSEYKEKYCDTTAVFCFCDYTAFRMMIDVRKDGIVIPDKLSFIGLNGQRMGVHTEPPLTSMRIPLPEMGKLALELMNSNENPDRLYKLSCTLLERQSVAKLN
jgi:DNA-binding LacI/PurR family transcriptional regulator